MKRLMATLLTLVMLMGLPAVLAEQTYEPTDSLVLYTAASATEYELIVQLFNEKYPDISVEVVSGGTGELASRITAEKDNPYGDVLMGGGGTTYEGIREMILPYATVNLDKLFPAFVPEDHLYTPSYVNVNSIIVNKALIEELGVTVDGWESLTDERLKGNISFASPADSSSAMEALINMLAAMAPDHKVEDGWDFAKAFLKNLDGKLASGSSAAYKNVVEGEYAVGLTNEDKTISYMKEGAGVFAVYPKEGITLRTSNTGIIKGGANTHNAQLFVDFVTSFECQTAMEAQLNVRPARTDVAMTTEGRVATEDLVTLPYPSDVSSSDIKTQFQDVWTSF